MSWWVWLLVSWPAASVLLGLLLGRAVRRTDPAHVHIPAVTDAQIAAFLEGASPQPTA